MTQQQLEKQFAKHCAEYTPLLQYTASTNSAALDMSNTLSGKTVIAAPLQSDGRGRENRRFVSREGGAYFSIIDKGVTLELGETAKIVYSAGLAVRAALEHYGLSPELKWPNDVQINGKKICGILCESILLDNSIATVVTGIGINVNNDISDIDNAARVSDYCADCAVEELIALTVKHFCRYLSMAKQQVLSEYRDACITIGKRVIIEATGMEGLAVAINERGLLTVSVDDKIIEVKAGDVRLKE